MSAASAEVRGADALLRRRFDAPPAEARLLKIIHSWPDEPAQQDQLIRSLQRQGFGGLVCNVSFTDYLQSEAKWQAFRRAVTEARRAGLALWLYDEKGYPSGTAGGLVLRDRPEWEARGLLVADVEGGPEPITLELPPGRLRLAVAFPVVEGKLAADQRADLTASVLDGRVVWEPPSGRWHVVTITEHRLFDGTHAELNLAAKLPYPNLLLPEPTARFLELTHDRYAQHLGTNLGQTFVATFTDEPSLMSLFLRRMPYRPLPWAASFGAEFKRRRGYALEPFLADLVVEASPETARHRYDYWQTIGELVSEHFFGQIQERCRRYQLRSGGHLLAEEGIVGHVPLYGDFFRCVRRLDAPSIDCLTSLPAEVPWYVARLVASAAELDRQPIVMCETSDHSQVWRPAGDQRPKRVVSEAEIRGTCNRLIVSGVNVITSYYSFTDLSDDQLRRLNAWIGRCCAVLQGGHQVADIAVVYPVESLWTHFVPGPHWANAAPAANRIEHLYRAALDGLFAARRDLTVIDSRALIEAKLEQDALLHDPLRWRVMVLPGVDTLPLAAWRKLAAFVRNGGVAIALGARPMNSESDFPSPQVRDLAQELFGAAGSEISVVTNAAGGAGVFLPAGAEMLLPTMLERWLEPDVGLKERQAPVRVTHRRVGQQEVYFLVNDGAQPWEGGVKVCAGGPGEVWDPANGQVSALPDAAAIRLQLPGYGAKLLCFSNSRLPARYAVKSSGIPDLTIEALPDTMPLVSRGEFVREVFGPGGGSPEMSRPVWRARARLTKGQTDTFLFVRFAYPHLLDLRDAECLEFESWVPDGQRAPTQLLAIVQEEGGGDFLGTTSRSLGAPGREQVFIPLNRLQLAGWSQDADGVLDLAKVKEIRLGWGGYYGTEGEQVEFSLTAPRRVRSVSR
jgi:hypothetical protein